MINYCPNDYENRNVKSRCEDLPLNFGEKKYSYLQDIPVHSQDTDLVYANVFCAICHDDFLNLTKSKGRFLINSCSIGTVIRQKMLTDLSLVSSRP